MEANVLFKTLISSGNILEIIFHQHLTIYVPRKLKDEFLSHQREIQIKSHLSQQSLNLIIKEVFKRIIFIESESYNPFLTKAQNLLHHHQKDQDFITLSLPSELHRFVKKHNEINWSEIARRAISAQAKKMKLMENL